ncbi:MAG: M48 family metallopeptidase, partial [Bacteroidales bacterium]|nr:M48 family metallopeptidase [Bacteroidales bacterium]
MIILIEQAFTLFIVMENNFFWLIIILLIGNFLLENGLTLLNYYYYPQKSLPSLIAGFYNQEKYAKSMAYEQAKTRFGILISIVQFVFILLFFVLGGFGWLDRLVQSISDQYLIRNLTFFGILIFSTDLLSLPISYYNTFVLEEKFGFNKTTLRTFILDKLKSWGLILIVGGGILALVVFIYEKSGAHFWWLTWISISVFSLLLTTFYSEWIVPLFNKQLPLESGSLRTAIEDFALKSGFKLDAIFTIDGSKRSTKANAYFSGLGSKKRVVLYDTLIHDLEEQELIAVLAHEIGHYKKKHTLLGLVLSILQTGLMLFI